MPESYVLPEVAYTLSELNRFGAVIANSLYFLIVAIIVIFLVHKFAKKFLFPTCFSATVVDSLR
jgi:hypothetical protein